MSLCDKIRCDTVSFIKDLDRTALIIGGSVSRRGCKMSRGVALGAAKLNTSVLLIVAAPALKDSQELRLQLKRQTANFVPGQRPTVRQFKTARATCEGATLTAG